MAGWYCLVRNGKINIKIKIMAKYKKITEETRRLLNELAAYELMLEQGVGLKLFVELKEKIDTINKKLQL